MKFKLLSIVLIIVSGITGCLSFDSDLSIVDTEAPMATSTDRLYSEAGSDLILSVPSGLAVEDSEIATIYQSARNVPGCRYSSGDPVPIKLAEVCVLYDLFYLFPDYLPASLDGLDDAADYVNLVHQSDPFTFFYTPEAYAEHKLFREGESAHIGFRYRCDGEIVSEQTPFVIETVYPHTRAWIDGLQENDIILAVNEIRLAGRAVETATDLFPNQEGAVVDLLVQRGDQEITISTAAEEHIALLLAPETAYLSVRSFTFYTGTEVKQDFQQLQEASSAPIQNIILDLRDNPGGSNAGMLGLIDYLIDQDLPAGTRPIMTLDGTYYQNATSYLGDYDTENIGSFSAADFVVLVDNSSASAAEVTTAALQYYDTATVMGVQTFGKGVSQFVFELLDGSGVWIPAHYVYPPDGVSFHQIGVTPDYTVTAGPISFSADPLLTAANTFLQTGEVSSNGSTREQRKSPVTVGPDGDPLEKRRLIRGKFWK